MKKPFNKIILQVIAIVMMTIDHVTWLVFPGYPTEPLPIILHLLGRITFPIMAFFIAEGYHYTHDKKKYILRIFIFSLISHVPYMLQSIPFKEYGWLALIPFATGNGIGRFLGQASVLWSYLMGLLMLVVLDKEKLNIWAKRGLIALLCIAAFPADWSCIGSLIVVAIYTNRGKPLKQILYSMVWIGAYAIVYFFAIDKIYGLLQLGVILAIPILMLYNGKKSNNPTVNKIFKWFFYIYYPLHLLIIGLIGLFLS